MFINIHLGPNGQCLNKIKPFLYKYDNPSVCITSYDIIYNSNIYLEKHKHESMSSKLTFMMTFKKIDTKVIKSLQIKHEVKWQIKIKLYCSHTLLKT